MNGVECELLGENIGVIDANIKSRKLQQWAILWIDNAPVIQTYLSTNRHGRRLFFRLHK